MAATDDVFHLTLIGSANNKSIVNSFTYRCQGNFGNALAARTAFNLQVQPKIADVLSVNYQFVELRVVNLNNPLEFEFYAYPPATLGQIGGENVNTFSALGYNSPTKNLSIRAGSKRFGPLSEAWCNGNNLASGTTIDTNTEALRVALNMTLQNAGNDFLTPAIIKRVKTIVGGKPVYSLPATVTSGTWYWANNWAKNPILRSQISRKP